MGIAVLQDLGDRSGKAPSLLSEPEKIRVLTYE